MKWNWVEKNTFSVSQKSLWKACSSDFRWPTADRKERKKISNLNWGAKVTYLKKRKLGFIKHVYIYTRICYVFFLSYGSAVLTWNFYVLSRILGESQNFFSPVIFLLCFLSIDFVFEFNKKRKSATITFVYTFLGGVIFDWSVEKGTCREFHQCFE